VLEEIFEGPIEIDARLLQRHGVEVGKPTVFPAALGDLQNWLQVVHSGQLVTAHLVAMPFYCQRLVEDEPDSAELPIEEAGLLFVRVDADFDSAAHRSCARFRIAANACAAAWRASSTVLKPSSQTTSSSGVSHFAEAGSLLLSTDGENVDHLPICHRRCRRASVRRLSALG
jgi:hypothetical protein